MDSDIPIVIFLYSHHQHRGQATYSKKESIFRICFHLEASIPSFNSLVFPYLILSGTLVKYVDNYSSNMPLPSVTLTPR